MAFRVSLRSSVRGAVHLTTLDAGTRVARFMIQDLVGVAYAPFRRTESWTANVVCTAIAVGGWGWFLYQGVIDPLGGINTLWPLFGIANQMLAGIALTFCCVVMVKMKRERYLWIPLLPTSWLLVCTLTAGWQKLFHPDPRIGFLANAERFSAAASRGEVLGPATSLAEMQRVAFNHARRGLCAFSSWCSGNGASENAPPAPQPSPIRRIASMLRRVAAR
jgi:carbon starvation protein